MSIIERQRAIRNQQKHQKLQEIFNIELTSNFINNSSSVVETKIKELESTQKDIWLLQQLKKEAEEKLKHISDLNQVKTSKDFYIRKHHEKYKLIISQLEDHNLFHSLKYNQNVNCSYCKPGQLSCQICFFKGLVKKNFIGSSRRLEALIDYENKKGDISRLEKGYRFALKTLKKK